MSTSEKLITMGIGFIFTAILIAVGVLRHVFPDRDRAKRMWAVVIPAFVMGTILLILGFVMG